MRVHYPRTQNPCPDLMHRPFEVPMCQTKARRFHCVRCHALVVICSSCDRGNTHCSKECSKASRREKQLASDRRYQATWSGRINHSARNQTYRHRIKVSAQLQIVTEQGSPRSDSDALLHTGAQELKTIPVDASVVTAACLYLCAFCGSKVPEAFRDDFIRRRSPSAYRYISKKASHDPRERPRRKN